MLLTSTLGEVLEVAVTSGLVVATLGAMVAIPFIVQFWIEDRRKPEE